MMVMDRLMVL